MKFSAVGSAINWNASDFHRVAYGDSHRSAKHSLSLAIQINVIVETFDNKTSGRSRILKGSMTTYTAGDDGSCREYRVSQVQFRDPTGYYIYQDPC